MLIRFIGFAKPPIYKQIKTLTRHQSKPFLTPRQLGPEGNLACGQIRFTLPEHLLKGWTDGRHGF
jgi:hypothetical protein